MEDLLKSFISKYDFKAGVLPVKRLTSLEDDFKGCLQKGFIDDKVYESYLKGFSFNVPNDFKEARSIIILTIAPI